jgi:hypothetical protein
VGYLFMNGYRGSETSPFLLFNLPLDEFSQDFDQLLLGLGWHGL